MKAKELEWKENQLIKKISKIFKGIYLKQVLKKCENYITEVYGQAI
jgi:hypothetical protein